MSVEPERPRERPKPFAKLWDAPGTPHRPQTVAEPIRDVPRTTTRIGVRTNVDMEGGIHLSPDGGEVAFAWDRSGAMEIYTAPLVGDRVIQLTEAEARSTSPRWSPDGHWVAFLRDDGSPHRSLWLVDRDGEHEHPLTRSPGAYRDPAWSPDGRRIAIADGRAIHLVDASTGERTRVADGAQPRWSSDGSSILFSSDGALFAIDATGGEARALALGGIGRATDASWSPDGSMLAFTLAAQGKSEIAFAYVADGAIARVERLGVTPFQDSDPVWRPDGRGVVYHRREKGSTSLRRVFTVSHADDAVLDVPGTCGPAQVGLDSETVVAVLAEPVGGASLVVRPKGAIAIARIVA
jgi:Tol biopolymer transport system component